MALSLSNLVRRKSDKPPRLSDYTYQKHMDWLAEWLVALDLRRLTLFCQDWGSLLGLRLAMEHPDRFDRIVVANGFLPTGDRGANAAFRIWRAFATWSPWFPIGRIVNSGVVSPNRVCPSRRRPSSTPATMLPHWSEPPICNSHPMRRASSAKS